MASHLSTPRSIREAPTLQPVLLHETKGPNRKDRRHGGGWANIDGDGYKRIDYGAKAVGFFKRTKTRKELVSREGRRLSIITPGPSFAEAYPSQNEPYRKPVLSTTSVKLYADMAKFSAAMKKATKAFQKFTDKIKEKD